MQFTMFMLFAGSFTLCFGAGPNQKNAFSRDFFEGFDGREVSLEKAEAERKAAENLKHRTDILLTPRLTDKQMFTVLDTAETTFRETHSTAGKKSKLTPIQRAHHYFYKDLFSHILKTLLTSQLRLHKGFYAKDLTDEEQRGIFAVPLNIDDYYEQLSAPQAFLDNPQLHSAALKVIQLSQHTNKLVQKIPVGQIRSNEPFNKSLTTLETLVDSINLNDPHESYKIFVNCLYSLTLGTINGRYARAFGSLSDTLPDEYENLIKKAQALKNPLFVPFLNNLSGIMLAADLQTDPHNAYLEKLSDSSYNFKPWVKEFYTKTLGLWKSNFPTESTIYTFDKIAYHMPDTLDMPFTLKEDPQASSLKVLTATDEWLPSTHHTQKTGKGHHKSKSKNETSASFTSQTKESPAIPSELTKKKKSKKDRNEKQEDGESAHEVPDTTEPLVSIDDSAQKTLAKAEPKESLTPAWYYTSNIGKWFDPKKAEKLLVTDGYLNPRAATPFEKERRHIFLNVLRIHENNEESAKQAIITAHTVPTQADKHLFLKVPEQLSPFTYKLESLVLRRIHEHQSFGTFEIIYEKPDKGPLIVFHRLVKSMNRAQFEQLFDIQAALTEVKDSESLIDDELRSQKLEEETAWQPVQGDWIEDTTDHSFVLLTHPKTDEKIYIIK